MHAAEGILTTRGGMTSHAAVVARGMGKPCVSGAGAIRIDYAKQTMTAGGVTLKKGDVITIDGAPGEVMAGAVPMVKPELTGDFATLMGWADAVTAHEGARQRRDAARRARRALVRRRGHRPLPHRAHVLRGRAHRRGARDDPRRRRGGTPRGARQAPADAAAGFRRAVRDHDAACRSRSACSIRRCTSSCRRRTRRSTKSPRRWRSAPTSCAARAGRAARIQPDARLPRLRLAVRYPEIAEMQARAIFEGAVEAGRKTGKPVTAEIMVPLVFGQARARPRQADHRRDGGGGRQGDRRHGALSCRHDDRTAARGAPGAARSPRAPNSSPSAPTTSPRRRSASRATTPRRSSASTPAKGLLPADPFVTLDTDGVGELVKIAAERGARDAARHQARHLRRARRRSGLDRLLRDRRVSTTCPARPSASRSPGSPRRRRRSGGRPHSRREGAPGAHLRRAAPTLQVPCGDRAHCHVCRALQWLF